MEKSRLPTSAVLGVALSLLVFLPVGQASLIIETLGSPNDAFTQNVVQQCLHNATLAMSYPDKPGFGGGHCPSLIQCILSNLREIDKAGMSAATSIVSLLPTLLALVGK